MSFDAYSIYCRWQRDRGLPVPSREWWEAHQLRKVTQEQDDTQFDIETERREGWTYDYD